MIYPDEEIVLAALSFSEWKTGTQIGDEVYDKFGLRFTAGSLYRCLQSFVLEGLAESACDDKMRRRRFRRTKNGTKESEEGWRFEGALLPCS